MNNGQLQHNQKLNNMLPNLLALFPQPRTKAATLERPTMRRTALARSHGCFAHSSFSPPTGENSNKTKTKGYATKQKTKAKRQNIINKNNCTE
jgi:hypothetical protein